jgi:D-sedoheptulose 7-phosphate isomerase
MDRIKIENRIRAIVEDSIRVKRTFFKESYLQVIEIAGVMASALQQNNKLLFFGNGGSAADAQHLAGEFVNRFLKERPALAAVALTTDTSIITSIGNDSDFDHIFARQIEALGMPGDVAIGLSTSGNSINVLNAVHVARNRGLHTVVFLGRDGGKLSGEAEHTLIVRDNSTPRIQETHITLGHILCEIIEGELYPA